MEDPPGKREVDMWHVAAGCLAVAGILSREPGLTLAGLLIWAGRAYVSRDSAAPEQPIEPIDSLLQTRRSLISLSIALFILAVIVGPIVKDEDCDVLRSASDYLAEIFLVLHFASCWSLWRNFGVEQRRKIAVASLGMLAVVVLRDQLRSCERYAFSLATVLIWLVQLGDAAICGIALSRSREEKNRESSGPITEQQTIERGNERRSNVTSVLGAQSRRVALWLVLTLVFLLLFKVFSGGLGRQQTREPEIIYSDFLNQVDRGQVANVFIQGHSIHGELVSGERFLTYAPDDPDLIKKLREKNVRIFGRARSGEP
jgi:hypothetical protein